MAGEISKKIGDDGEKLAREFLSKIHWPIVDENVNILCLQPKEHDRSASPPAHGVDFIVAYDCPLVHTTRQNVLISMKNSAMEKTKNQTSVVKTDLRDLGTLISCFKRSEERKRINKDTSRASISFSGLLIKINKDKDEAESFLPQSDEKRLSLESNAEVHFMENKRFDFVDLAVEHLLNRFREHHWTYFYPPTTANYAADVAEIEGEVIPLQHLIGGPLTFRLTPKEIGGNRREFAIFSPDSYSDSDLCRLIGLANGCSHGWAHRITIVFPSLSPDDKVGAEKVAKGVKSQTFADTISVESFETRSRFK